MKNVLMVTFVALFLVGCAATKQAIQDYKTGASTPIVNGEVSPSEKAAPIVNTVASLPVPFAGAAAPILAIILGGFFTWQRGSQIRKNGGAPVATSSSPNTPHVVQDLANIVTGTFSLLNSQGGSTAGTIMQRFWKVALATAASGIAVAVADPAVASFLTAHPFIDTAFIAISGGIAGLEKGMSNIPVTAPATTA